MSVNTHYIHPECNIIRQTPEYMRSPMKVSCILCGQTSDSHPFPTTLEIEGNNIVSGFPVCSITCMRNFATGFMINNEHCITICSSVLSTAYGIDIEKLGRAPPVEALQCFGGPLQLEEYREPYVNWPYESSQNPWIYRPFKEDDPAWKTDFTGSGQICFGCLMPIEGLACPSAIRYDETKDKVEMTNGIFHRNGTCALRYVAERANMFTELDKYWTTKMLNRAPFCISMDQLFCGHSKSMLTAFGGPLTLQEFLDVKPDNVFTVRWQRMQTYNMFLQRTADLDSEKKLLKVLTDNKTFDVRELTEYEFVKQPYHTFGENSPLRLKSLLITIQKLAPTRTKHIAP